MNYRQIWVLLILMGGWILPACQAEAEPPAAPSAATTAAINTAVSPTSSPAPSSTETAVPPPTSEYNASANADVLFVRATQSAGETWTFHVTVAHPDTGWEDYADGWDVVLPNETVVLPDSDSPFTRLLLHPHENEQPFTRSQSGIVIPSGTETVRVRAHDLVDGFGGQEVVLDWSAADAGTAVATDQYEIVPRTAP